MSLANRRIRADIIAVFEIRFDSRVGYHGKIMEYSLNLILGVLAIAYGVYSYIQRKTAPEKIAKLQIMIERNGEKMGHSIHLFGYTILPIVAGILILMAQFRN